MNRRFTTSSLYVVLAAATLMGCRGNPSEDPPIHLQRNMFSQDKGKVQRLRSQEDRSTNQLIFRSS